MDLPSLLKTEIFPAPFSETLSSLNILSGSLDYQLSAKGILKQPFHFQHQGVYRFSKTRLTHRQIPFPILVFLGMVALWQFILSKTTLGRYSCAVGGNKETSRLSGVPVDFYHIMTFVIGGVMAALAGIIYASRLNAAEGMATPPVKTISFQPSRYSSMRTWGVMVKALRSASRRSRGVQAIPLAPAPETTTRRSSIFLRTS
jgi:predicted ABC-type sugar transport system permease subunit